MYNYPYVIGIRKSNSLHRGKSKWKRSFLIEGCQTISNTIQDAKRVNYTIIQDAKRVNCAICIGSVIVDEHPQGT
jgi:hypothetical protein